MAGVIIFCFLFLFLMVWTVFVFFYMFMVYMFWFLLLLSSFFVYNNFTLSNYSLNKFYFSVYNCCFFFCSCLMYIMWYPKFNGLLFSKKV